jgi:branched-chain amino acid transport system substrate-binding protein
MPVVAAVATALALTLSACGGSDVTDTAATGPADLTTQTDTSTGDAPATDSATTDTSVPGSGAAPGTDTTAPGTDTKATTGKAPGDTRTGPATNSKSSGNSKPNTAVDTGVAAARMIGSAPIFGGKTACKPATLSEVSIGNVSTLSGVLGELFAPVVPALETFVASQNACGGLNGHKIKFFQGDDQGDPATAVARVTDMIQKNKVLAFVGNIEVLTVDAIVPTIKKFGVPVIGADMTNNTWFTNSLMFPQGSPPQAVAYGYVAGAVQYHKTKNIGIMWCIEVPRSCEQINRAFLEVAPTLGAVVKKSIQVSITAPSYVQQCLELKNAGVETVALNLDAASQVRVARSCQQVGYHPHVVTYPVAVGNEKQFFGDKWLGNAYVPQNTFAWMDTGTAAERYYQASVKKYNPGFETGGAASLGWTAGALLVAAGAGLSPENPTTQQLLDTLYTFKGQSWTTLGGLSPSPLTYRENSTPKVPYCYFYAVTNDANNGWKASSSKPTCTDFIAPSDPQKSS